MRQVQRGPAPTGFDNQAQIWQKEFVTAQTENPKLTPSQFWDKIRQHQAMVHYAQRLKLAFHYKCVFCESQETNSPLQLEHYRPKSSYVDQMFVWDNWLLACGTCNTNKGTKFPLCQTEPCFVDPVTENPDNHVGFEGARILYKTDRGKYTIATIKLDREILLEARREWLKHIGNLLLSILYVPEEIKFEVRQLLIWSMQPDAPFSVMTTAYLSRLAPKLVHPNTPHPFINPIEPQKRISELVELHKDKFKNIT